MPDVLVTGATGFIGGAILDRLVSDGRSVRALYRSDSDAEGLRRSGAEPVHGDITDLESVTAAMAGCSVVFHVAGLNAMCLRDGGALERVNVAGSRTVVRAAAANGVDRVVYTSSAAAIGEPHGTIGTEETVHRGSYVTSYERSKHLAELAVFEEAERLSVDVVAVNPSSVQGPGRTGGTARLLIGFLKGSLRFAVKTRMSLVSIDDCVEGHLLAEQRGVPGNRYLTSGAVITVSEALHALARVSGVDRQVRYLPPWLVRAAGALIGGGSRLLRRDAPFCSEMAKALLAGHAYDGSRAVRDLGLEYTPLDTWLGETVAWYRENGIV